MLPLLLVLAAAPIDPGGNARLLGWSADGLSIAWTETVTTSSPARHYFRKGKGKQPEVPMAEVMAMSEADRKALAVRVENEEQGGSYQTDEEATIGVVQNIRTNVEKRFLLGIKTLTPQAKGELQKKFATLSDAAAWESWKKENNPGGTKGLEGPGGAKASVLVAGKPTLKWAAEGEVTVQYVVTHGADKATSSTTDQMEAMYIPKRSVEVLWEPSGRRALFITNTAEARTMRGPIPPTTEYLVVAAPPRVEVLATVRVEAEAERIIGVVEKSGFAVTFLGPAQKERPTTVIYADAAHQELAQKLSAALPGSTVDKLSWKASGELVIAVGAPAK